MSNKNERINQKQLIKAVADDCNYLVYEVQDVLESLRRVITAALVEGKEVKLEHLLMISPKINAPRLFLHPSTGKMETSAGSVSCSIKLSQYLKDVLNEKYKDSPADAVSEDSSDVQSMHEPTIQPKSRRKFTAADQLNLL